MSKDVDVYTLPASSNDLCFDGNAFIKESFSADIFLQEHRGRASLETMRDDLGSYLKVLRSATLDLIDQEYADFVGLSSSLVGLDKAVQKIRDPLGQLREEVMTVKSSLEEAVKGVKNQLDARRKLRTERAKLEFLSKALSSLQRLECLLENDIDSKDISSEINQSLATAERAAAEFNHMTFCLGKCDKPENLSQRTESVRIQLTKLLENMLLEALKSEDKQRDSKDVRSQLVRLLCTYASLGMCDVAEELIGERVIAPALDEAMKSSNPKSAGRASAISLAEVYCKVLSIVDFKLGKLLELTVEGQRPPSVKGFDFLAHSLWPQFVKRLDLHLPSINAPGNPDIFHQRYSETMAFLDQLEKYCGTVTAVERMRSQPSYQPFLNSWNLPVYFQIRFQEIAGSVEAILPSQPHPSNGFDANSIEDLMGLKETRPSHEGFWILQTSTAWDCILRCWDSKVFLPQLTHRFWKLNLQILARYCVWSKEIVEHQMKSVKDSSSNYSGENGEDTGAGMEFGSTTPQNPVLAAALLLPICLHRDADQLSARLQTFLLPRVTHLLNQPENKRSLSQDVGQLLQRSLNDSLEALAQIEPLASQCVIRLISQGSLPHLRQCRDIPRFFRRTNRAHPTRPRPYVGAALGPPLNFRAAILASFSSSNSKVSSKPNESSHAWVSSELLSQWMARIFSEITVQYYADVSEVLTSVQKMEESLRRLKRIKGVGSKVQDGGVESSSTDDDDKIRAQLALDVHCFCQLVESTGLAKGNVKQLPELLELVNNATNKDSSIKS